VPTVPDIIVEIKRDSGAARGSILTCDKAYVVTHSKSSWGNTRSWVRKMQDKKVADDRRWERSAWRDIWANYRTLVTTVGLPAEINEYAVLDSGQYRSSYVSQCGWKVAHEAIKEYLERADVQDAVRKAVAGFAPMAPAGLSYHHAGWVSGLSYYLTQSPDTQLAAVKATLKGTDLLKRAQDMADERRVKVKKAPQLQYNNQDLPPALHLFQELATELGVSTPAKFDSKTKVTIGDIDTAFSDRFPMARTLHFHEMWDLVGRNPDHGCELIKLVLSKEA
jgi:hypothetical protein